VTIRIALNGTIGDEASARVSVLDRGFLYGDSVYEVIRTYGGRPFALPDHLRRLQRSAELLDMQLPVELPQLTQEIEATIAAAGNPESYIRVIVTRGSGPIGLDPALASEPQRVVIVTPLRLLAPEVYETGVKVCLVAAGRTARGDLPLGAKSGNYLANLLSLRIARQHQAHEAIMLDAQGRVLEGSTSNIFAWIDDTLITPPLHVGLLEGITRAKVIALAQREAIPFEERELWADDLRRASEVFLTSTLREVLPVTQVDTHEVGNGHPGPLTLRVRRGFRALADAQEQQPKQDEP
jgi:branched-chain amino acid aminotransferase